MMHAWSHVRLRDDAEWLGPAPAERAHELKFIEEFGEQWKAAAKIQVRPAPCFSDMWWLLGLLQ